ncbi:MAG: type II toxin-antitoxin system HicB family antitoxin [bacterium]|nr:type II toxin-antitoxin system HicB family antitoxin [bacterium]
MNTYKLACVIEKDEDGYYGYCPELKACHAQGDTFEEVLTNLRDVLSLLVQDKIAEKEPIPSSELINFTTIEVTV